MPCMSGEEREPSPLRVLVPHAPALVAGFREVLWLSPEGEIEALAPAEARSRVEPAAVEAHTVDDRPILFEAE